MCNNDCLSTCREDDDNSEDPFVAGVITGDSQLPTLIQDNPAYVTSMNTQRQIALSSNPAYSIVNRDSQQAVLQDKPMSLAANWSVVSLDMIGREIYKPFTLCSDFQDWHHI